MRTCPEPCGKPLPMKGQDSIDIGRTYCSNACRLRTARKRRGW